MILHQQILNPENAPRDPWLALHCESLSLALCEQHGYRIHITPVHWIHPANPVSNCLDFTASQFTDLVSQDIRRHIPGATTLISSLPTSHSALGTENYLLVNSLDGTTPAILHTQDPVALYLADPSGTLGPAQYFRSSIDLSVEGWAYWWEDAQRAFHKLTVEFCQECGIPISDAISAAVRHD